MISRIAGQSGRIRSSLFFIPMVCVIAAAMLGEAMLLVDSLVGNIDTRLTATVDSARTVLTTVASATLAFAGVAFSVSLLLISLASSQYSPRVVHGMFTDPFNKRVMGLVIGTFTYCLVVLRAVRTSLNDDGEAIVPSVSILVAVVLGIASVLSIVAFINHAAHFMDVSKILHRVTREALNQAGSAWPERDPDSSSDTDTAGAPDLPDGAAVVRFDKHGWVQNIDYDRLLGLFTPGSLVRLNTYAGRYAIHHAPICFIWPPPADVDDVADAVRAAIMVGESRTLQQDLAYGVRQLADVALKALSTGVNDPTTAHDAISHLSTVLSNLLRRELPAQRISGEGGRVLLVPYATTVAELIGLGFNEVRIAAAGQPTMLIYLLDALHTIEESLAEWSHSDAVTALRRQADLIHSMNEGVDQQDLDRERVREAYAQRYPDGPT